MRLFPLFFCLFLSLVWPVIFNVSLLFIILVGCFYLDIMISIHAWAGYWANWINEIGFLVLLDFMPDLFYLGYVATMFFPVWTLLSRIFLFHHLDSFCMKLNDFEDWKEILGTGIVLVIGKDLQIWSDTLTYAILNKNLLLQRGIEPRSPVCEAKTLPLS